MRSLALRLGVAAVIAMIIGTVIPPVIITMRTLLPTEQTTYHRSESASGDVVLERTTSTSPGEERDEVRVDSELTVLVDDQPFAEVTDHTELFRDNAMPIDEPVHSSTVTIPAENLELDSGVGLREGIRHFFPPTTERRSFPFYDPLTGTSTPIDYVDEVEIEDVTANVYSQTLSGVSVGDTGAHYFVDRTLTVEPDTGVILDTQETLSLSRGERTFFSAETRWDEETRQAQLDLVTPTLRLFRVLQIIAWIGTVAAALLALGAVLAVAKMRKERRAELLAVTP